MDVGDKRLYLAVCVAHRHLLQSILEFTLFPSRIGGEGRAKHDNILESEREVRKFARRVWQYLERIRCFLGAHTGFDEVDVRVLRDEAVKCTQLTVVLQLRHAQRTSTIPTTNTINLGEVARGRFLLRLHESLKRRSFNRESVLLMEEGQIRACIMDVKNMLSPNSITHHQRRGGREGQGGGGSGNQSRLWTWLMKKTAFLNLKHSHEDNGDEGHWKEHVEDILMQHSTHSDSRESKLFGSSDSSEFMQALPMFRGRRQGRGVDNYEGSESQYHGISKDGVGCW